MMIGNWKEKGRVCIYCTILEKARRPVIRKHKTIRDLNLGCSRHNAVALLLARPPLPFLTCLLELAHQWHYLFQSTKDLLAFFHQPKQGIAFELTWTKLKLRSAFKTALGGVSLNCD